MANKVIKVRNKVKYDTEANWAKSDPVLLAGEIAVSSDRNNRMKVGDGTSKWSALAFSGLKVGSNITLADDTISITKTNVTTALGYTPPTTNTTYNDATQSTHGLMSATDKTKLDGIATGANKTVVDSAMSTTSTNPVQNKVVKTEIDKKMNIEATQLTNENLDNIKTYGFYYAGGSNTVTNKPTNINAFGLHVYRSASGYIVQELTGADANERCKYIRQFTSSAWSAWAQEAIFSATPTSGQVVIADGTEGKVKTSGYTIASSIPSGAKFTDTVYTHPSATAYASGMYKITTNNLGHVTAATAVTKADITGLGIPSADTHYTTGLKVGASATATANAAATNGNVYINALDNTTVRDSHKVVGSGATTVTSDANGVITVNSTNTTYSDATQSAHGLMTAADKKKLDGIASGANAYTHPSHTAYASGLYKITTNALGHVTAATAVTKADITGLGIPSTDTNTWRGVQDNLTSTATDQSLSANQGKVLKGLVDAKLPLAGGKLTGRLEKSAGQFVYQTVGEAGKSGYIKLATFTIGTTYVNVPIEFTICRRSDLTPTRVSIAWASANTKDPALAGLKVLGVTNNIWIVKSAESVWDLYVLKTEAYDTLTVVEYYRPPYMDNVKVEWVGTLATALPTTNITQASYGYNVGYASSAGSANAVAWGNVSGKSNASQSAAGLMSADDKKKLDGIASGANAYTHPSATAYASGLYKITTNSLGHVTAATAVTKADITALGIPGQDTNTVYTHPTYTAKSSGLYKITVDGTGHVSAATAVTKNDITALGIPSADNNSTTKLVVGASNTANANAAATNGNVYMNLFDDSTLRNSHKIVGSGATTVASDASGNITISSTNTVYSHPTHTAYSSGLYKITVNNLGHVTSATAVAKSDITALGIPSTNSTTKLIAGASATATANADTTASNNAVYLNLMDDSTIRNSHKISGGGQTSVYSDASGNITINTTILAAATNRAGLMTAQDKTDLNRLHDTVYSATQPTGQNIGDYWVKLEG